MSGWLARQYSRRLFPRVLAWAMDSRLLAPLRRELLAPAGGEGLEIGFGTGANIPYYPASVRALAALDPNPGMKKYAAGRIGTAAFPVRSVAGAAESLPFADESFDFVVSTLTLCSVADPALALSEVKRVLRPGGRLYLLEHGKSPDPRVARWQHRLNPLQTRLGDGCHLDRDFRALLGGAGLRVDSLKNFRLERAPEIYGYMYQAVAAKNGR